MEPRAERAEGQQWSSQRDESGRRTFNHGTERAKLLVCCGLRYRFSRNGRQDHDNRERERRQTVVDHEQRLIASI